jgi:hypothetical protein
MKSLSCKILLLFLALSLSAQTPNYKRGISFGSQHPILLADLPVMQDYLTWFYNWGTGPGNIENALDDYDIEFVPMAWNGSFNEENLRTYYTNHPEAKYLLGFNEPNFLEQANMTPSNAAAQWPRLEAIADEFGLEIVGPAVNWCGSCVSEGGTTYTNPYTYLDDFFAACPDCRVDYIAVHNYMCYTEPLVSYLKAFEKYNKKIWLTEFACWDQANITLEMQKSYMLGALDYLDNDSMIYKYSWFIGRSGSGTPHIDIFESEGGKLTELGEIYLYYDARHDTSIYRSIPARIEAESYSAMSGIQLQATEDFNGLANVGWIDPGDFLQYNIDVPEAGDYYLYLRLSANAAANIEVEVNGESLTFLDIPYTGGWQSWETFNTVISLEEGKSNLKLITSTGNFNINWIRIEDRSNIAPTVTANENIYLVLPESTTTLTAVAADDDDDDDELVYQWLQTAGPSCTLTSPDSASTAIQCSSAGIYIFKITVSDGFDVASDLLIVYVSEATNTSIDVLMDITVKPNPFQDKVYLSLPRGIREGILEIVNISGQQVVEKQNYQCDGELEMDLSGEAPGIYFVKLTGTDGLRLIRIVKY